jgi:hypothetical protein
MESDIHADILCQIFSFLPYHAVPIISLVSQKWDEALHTFERSECWKVWLHEHVSESLSTCTKRERKKLQKLRENKTRSDKTLLINLTKHQKAKTLQSELVECNWSQFLPLLRKEPEITKYFFHVRPLGKSMISLMILKISQERKKYESKCDQLALSALHEMIGEFEAVFPNETHLHIMSQRRRSRTSLLQQWREISPFNNALRNGLIETARAIVNMNPSIMVELPTAKVTALEQVICGIQSRYYRDTQVTDALLSIKFVIEELKEPLPLTRQAEFLETLAVVPLPDIIEVLKYLFAKGFDPNAKTNYGSSLLIAWMNQYVCLTEDSYLKMVYLLLDAGAINTEQYAMYFALQGALNLNATATSEQVITSWKRKYPNIK